MMGSAEAVATAQHFVKERLKEIEARDLPACPPACLRLPTHDAHVTLTDLPCLHLPHVPSSLPAQGSQRAACGRWRRRADAGRVTQRSTAQCDGGAAGDSAPSPTPATPPLPPH